MYPDASKKLSYQTPDRVFFFSHGLDPLNNWSAHQVDIWNKRFATVEHAYQYRKFDITAPSVAERILTAHSPWAAYQLARTYKAQIRDDWDDLKVSFMVEIITAKLNQNEDVRDTLKQTGTKEIVENSPWDSFWGGGEDGLGQNEMGKIWMNLRAGL